MTEPTADLGCEPATMKELKPCENKEPELKAAISDQVHELALISQIIYMPVLLPSTKSVLSPNIIISVVYDVPTLPPTPISSACPRLAVLNSLPVLYRSKW